jgi:Icc-related predicted phosphoesterase
MIPEGTDVLITHGPPFGTLDQSHLITPHLGCEELAKAVLKLKPRLHIFGHIHGGHGRAISASGTQFVNASVLDEAYRLVHEAQVVEVETDTVARTSCPALRD